MVLSFSCSLVVTRGKAAVKTDAVGRVALGHFRQELTACIFGLAERRLDASLK